MRTLASLFMIATVLIYTGCASTYVNSKSRGELTEQRREVAARNLQVGEVPPEVVEPSVMEGVKNDPVGHAIAGILDLVAGWFIYDNVKGESGGSNDSQRSSVGTDQNITLDISGSENSVSISSSTSNNDTDSTNNNSNNDNRNFSQ